MERSDERDLERRIKALREKKRYVAGVEYDKFYLDSSYLDEKHDREHCRSFCRDFGTTFGLIIGNVVFCILGGILFNTLEEPNERQACNSSWTLYRNQRDNSLSQLIDQGSDFQQSAADRRENFEATLNNFIGAFAKTGWSGVECSSAESMWNIPSATFFCMTVITTIGYGYIAPSTFWGRLTLIAYALLGLPVYLTTLALAGDKLSEILCYSYHQVWKCGLCRRQRSASSEKSTSQRQKFEKILAVWRMEKSLTAREEAFIEALLDDNSGDEDLEDFEEASRLTADSDLIPVLPCLFILASCVYIGGSIFTVMEDWSLLDATYFAFISMATIGFGDLVPGVVSQLGQYKRIYLRRLLMCSVFIVVGMVMLSACLQMIQRNMGAYLNSVMTFLSGSLMRNGQGYDVSDQSDSSSDSDFELINRKNNDETRFASYDVVDDAFFLKPTVTPTVVDHSMIQTASSMSINNMTHRPGSSVPGTRQIVGEPDLSTLTNDHNSNEDSNRSAMIRAASVAYPLNFNERSSQFS